MKLPSFRKEKCLIVVAIITAAIGGGLLAGCGSKPQTAPTANVPPSAQQTPEQHAQEQTRILQTIRTMTPEQRAAYFKAHPADASAVLNTR